MEVRLTREQWARLEAMGIDAEDLADLDREDVAELLDTGDDPGFWVDFL